MFTKIFCILIFLQNKMRVFSSNILGQKCFFFRGTIEATKEEENWKHKYLKVATLAAEEPRDLPQLSC